MNEGYIRFWIGELLAAKGERKLAQTFLRAAELKWRDVSPTRAHQAFALAQQIQSRYNEPIARMDDQGAEGIILDWILSRQPQFT